jgi:hypothetical protein
MAFERMFFRAGGAWGYFPVEKPPENRSQNSSSPGRATDQGFGPAPLPGREFQLHAVPVVSPPANIRCPSGTKNGRLFIEICSWWLANASQPPTTITYAPTSRHSFHLSGADAS